MIRFIREFAINAHGSQKYGENLYVKHLDDVYEVLKRFGFDKPELLEAAYLHDIVEDTNISIQEIEKVFGWKISDLVWRVTSAEGKNRKERNERTYPKIAGDYWSIVLKLADRIANVEESIKTGSTLLHMYKKEYPYFKSSLLGVFVDERSMSMWNHLDNLLEDK